MNPSQKRKIVVLSGPVHTGNSDALMRWVKGKSVAGFITPTKDEKKILYAIETGETGIYEIDNNDEEAIKVGKYAFSAATFEKAKAITTRAIEQGGKQWFVLDEIGRLELKNEGHHVCITALLEKWESNLLFVVRDYLLDDVKSKYELTDAVVIDKQELMNLT